MPKSPGHETAYVELVAWPFSFENPFELLDNRMKFVHGVVIKFYKMKECAFECSLKTYSFCCFFYLLSSKWNLNSEFVLYV